MPSVDVNWLLTLPERSPEDETRQVSAVGEEGGVVDDCSVQTVQPIGEVTFRNSRNGHRPRFFES